MQNYILYWSETHNFLLWFAYFLSVFIGVRGTAKTRTTKIRKMHPSTKFRHEPLDCAHDISLLLIRIPSVTSVVHGYPSTNLEIPPQYHLPSQSAHRPFASLEIRQEELRCTTIPLIDWAPLSLHPHSISANLHPVCNLCHAWLMANIEIPSQQPPHVTKRTVTHDFVCKKLGLIPEKQL